jgi:hypothetical protein
MTQKQLHALVTAILFARRPTTIAVSIAVSDEIIARDVETAARIIRGALRTDIPGSVV